MIRLTLLELFMQKKESRLFPINCYTDNKSLLDSVYSTKTLKEKRLKIDVCIIREMLEKKEIESINWCSSDKQLADCLTKATSSSHKLINVLKREVAAIQMF